MACYGLPGSRWTFYEIDPVVQRIAQDRDLFTFLANTQADVEVVLGDGRLTLGAGPPDTYDVIVMDAFSSDAVPMHLLTEEFIRLALERTRAHGLLVFNISNRYLDLEPVLTATGERVGLTVLTQLDLHVTAEEASAGKTASRWLLMGRRDTIGMLALNPRWRPGRAGPASWTDDFSNIFDAVAWTPELAQGGARPIE
jgi:spermidine synthase